MLYSNLSFVSTEAQIAVTFIKIHFLIEEFTVFVVS